MTDEKLADIQRRLNETKAKAKGLEKQVKKELQRREDEIKKEQEEAYAAEAVKFRQWAETHSIKICRLEEGTVRFYKSVPDITVWDFYQKYPNE